MLEMNKNILYLKKKLKQKYFCLGQEKIIWKPRIKKKSNKIKQKIHSVIIKYTVKKLWGIKFKEWIVDVFSMKEIEK